MLGLEKEFEKVCKDLKFSEKQIQEIEIELARRNVSRSFKGMPLNLIRSMLRHDINHIRDYGKLDDDINHIRDYGKLDDDINHIRDYGKLDDTE